jgi:ATP-dependent Lon protease
VARKVAMDDESPVTINIKNVKEYLGVPKYNPELVSTRGEIGIANALAWTPVGGDTLIIESTWMPGGKSLKITGQLGDVMKESAEIALSYLRANAKRYNLSEGFFRKWDIHIHVPEGATPKDGPSAGVTMVTSLASLISNTPVRNDVGMTGEITLRGRVLPIGGVREKVVAANRAHLKTLILPTGNKKDLDNVPENIRSKLNFIFVDRIDQVLDAALLKSRKTEEEVTKELLEA